MQRWLGLTSLVRAICRTATGLLASGVLLTPSLAAAAPVALTLFLAPACNAALFGYQASITPDRRQGRVISVIVLVATSAAAAAPLLAGVLVTTWSSPTAILIFALTVSGSAITATLGTGIRGMRSLNDAALEEAPVR